MFTVNFSAGAVFGLGMGAGVLLGVLGLFTVAAIIVKKGK